MQNLNLELAKLHFRRSQLLKHLRMGLVHLLLTSDTAEADAFTEAICEGLLRNYVHDKQRKGKKHKVKR